MCQPPAKPPVAAADEAAGYPASKYPCVVDKDGVPRINGVAVDPLQGFKATELQMAAAGVAVATRG